VSLYSWLSAFGFGWGVLLAHLYPFVVGRPWTTCEAGGIGCKLSFHLFDVPMVAFNAYLIYFGFRKLLRATSRRYQVLLGFANVANLVFFAFEASVLQGSLARQAPLSELLSLSSVAVLLLSGTVLGFFVQVKLHTLLYPEGDDRYLHPSSEKELIKLVRLARQAGMQLRVRGSGRPWRHPHGWFGGHRRAEQCQRPARPVQQGPQVGHAADAGDGAGPDKDAEYSRLLWWPQKGLDKVQVWRARRSRPGEAFQRKPFESSPTNFVVLSVVNGLFNLIGKQAPPYVTDKVKGIVSLLKLFVPEGTVTFQDDWHSGLPMDNSADDELMPVEFTELFIDLDKTAEVMKALREFYAQDEGLERTGLLACEIYAAKQSKFWLSPSHGGDKLRIDVFWFRTDYGNPDVDFYPRYWELLKRFDYRYHWASSQSRR
jgi:D-arabinono-1,4-lactone oxidase